MEATKAALDSERKIQHLQMQAINALWKKISAMEADCRGKGFSLFLLLMIFLSIFF